MNRRKLLIAVSAMASLAAGAAVADGKSRERGVPPEPAEQVQRMTEHLGLDDNQAQTIEAILEQAAAERQAIGDRYTLNQRAEAHEAMMALKTQTQAQIAEQLTPEQRETFEKAMERREDRGRFRRFHRRAHSDDDADAGN